MLIVAKYRFCEPYRCRVDGHTAHVSDSCLVRWAFNNLAFLPLAVWVILEVTLRKRTPIGSMQISAPWRPSAPFHVALPLKPVDNRKLVDKRGAVSNCLDASPAQTCNRVVETYNHTEKWQSTIVWRQDADEK